MSTRALHLPGSRNAAVFGLESKFTYNGLILNDRSQADRYHIDSVDGFSGPDIRDSREVQSYDHGEVPGKNFFGGRTVILSGIIKAGNRSKLQDMREDLTAAFATTIERALVAINQFGPQVYITCRPIEKIAWKDEVAALRNETPFQISLRASDPFVYSTEVVLKTYSNMRSDGGFVADGLSNLGDWVARPVVSISDPPSSFSIGSYGVMPDETVRAVTTLYGAASSVSYDGRRKYATSSNRDPDFSVLSTDSQRFGLAPGDNFVTTLVQGSNSNTVVSVSYNHTWK